MVWDNAGRTPMNANTHTEVRRTRYLENKEPNCNTAKVTLLDDRQRIVIYKEEAQIGIYPGRENICGHNDSKCLELGLPCAISLDNICLRMETRALDAFPGL